MADELTGSTEDEAAAFASRRAAATAAIRRQTGIDETMIETLVHRFYQRVQADPLLGPIFADRITDWEPHLKRMMAFWSSVALLTGAYHGRPMQAHLDLAIDARHFDHWLALFAQTAHDVCPPAAAKLFIDRASIIARSFEAGIATLHAVPLRPGERYRNTAI